jgi:DNA-binding helix-hairpin-helix protein with protein kinase domain
LRAFIRHDGRRAAVDIDEAHPLGRGATARICPVLSPAYADRLAKVYVEPTKVDEAKLAAMLENPPSAVWITVDFRSYPQYAWPTHLLRERKGRLLGYLMPRVDEQQSLTLDFFYDRHLLGAQGLRDLTLGFQLDLARNLSAALADLHAHGHCFIDFKPQNIKVFRSVHLVALLDCDSYRIAGAGPRSFPATNFSSEYIAPEAFDEPLGPQGLAEAQDRFALAVVLFQLLNNGIHPFQGIQVAGPEQDTTDDKVRAGLYAYGVTAHPGVRPLPQSVHHLFDDGSRALFDRAFTTRERPRAREWADHFQRVLAEKQLERCALHPSDPTHIHFAGKGCAACHYRKVVAEARHAAPAAAGAGAAEPPTYVWPVVHRVLAAELLLMVMQWTGCAVMQGGSRLGFVIGAFLTLSFGGLFLAVRASLRGDMRSSGRPGEVTLKLGTMKYVALWLFAAFMAFLLVTFFLASSQP